MANFLINPYAVSPGTTVELANMATYGNLNNQTFSPPGRQAGDRMFWLMRANSSSPTADSDWTVIEGGAAQNMTFARRTATNDASDSYTTTVASTPAAYICGVMNILRTSMTTFTYGVVSVSGSTSQSTAGVTAPAAGVEIFMAWVVNGNDTPAAITTPPAGFTLMFDNAVQLTGSGHSSNRVYGAVYSRPIAAAGATGSTSWNTSVNILQGVSVKFAITP